MRTADEYAPPTSTFRQRDAVRIIVFSAVLTCCPAWLDRGCLLKSARPAYTCPAYTCRMLHLGPPPPGVPAIEWATILQCAVLILTLVNFISAIECTTMVHIIFTAVSAVISVLAIASLRTARKQVFENDFLIQNPPTHAV